MSNLTTRSPYLKYFWLTFGWIKFIVLLVVFSVSTLAIFAGAAETHWLVTVLIACFYGYALVLGMRDLRSDRLKTRQAAGSIVLMIVLFTAVFSSASFATYKLGWARYVGDTLQTEQDRNAFLSFVLFYWWLFLDLLPVLDITNTLHLESPLRAVNFAAGLPLVAFRGVVLLFLLKEIKGWWQRTRERSRETPNQALQPTEPAGSVSGSSTITRTGSAAEL